MDNSITPITNKDRKAIIDIFNHYVENSFAAYPEKKVPYGAFDMFLQMFKGYPTATVKDGNGKVIGFGFLRSYNPMATFSHTAEITYFISPDYTGKGIGKELLDYLLSGGKEKGLTNILANISSVNSASIRFHKKNGFKECGRFQNVCRKNGRYFDVIWMQKIL